MLTRRLRKACGLLGCLGVLALSGCEEGEDESQYNDGHGRSDFIVDLGGHMFNGESKEKTSDVRSGSAYNVRMVCSNDGDSDLINVYADGTKIISYKTDENRRGGAGWYIDQTTADHQFVTSSNQVVFRVKTITDSWGTWPKYLVVSEVQDN